MLQRLLIALTQVKAGNTSGNEILLNEIRQLIYSYPEINIIEKTKLLKWYIAL